MAYSNSLEKTLDAVAAALKRDSRVLVTTHIKPDGDALGCVIAMHRALTQIGIDSSMYMAGAGAIAPEYRFLEALDEVHHVDPPEGYAKGTLCVLDCGNAERVGNDELLESSSRIINIDHHSDNPRYGDINLVAGGASSTAEVLYFLFKKMEVDITPVIAEALYVGVLTDSGRFQYASTTPTTFRVAADLVSSGVDHADIFRHVYETVPLEKTRLLCRMFNRLTLACGGRLAIGVLEKEDFKEAGAGVELTDGLVNGLRELDGVEVSALVYSFPADDEADQDTSFYRVSLRSSSEQVNVQRIARARGGGGHQQAAGFSVSGEPPSSIIEYITAKVDESLHD